jgi:tetratricopeptide (TPR) repeat protein
MRISNTCTAEMEMGLVEDAKERFVAAASRSSGAQSRASKFGEGLATFTIGQRELQDGKAGAALKHTLEAIAACEFLADQSCSASKFVADMHTALAAFPAKLFVSDESISGPDSEALKAHVALVAKGEVLYASAVERVPPSDDGEDRLSRASLVFDGAVNLLLQAQLKARWRGYSGQECASDCLLLSDFQRAEGRFREALDLEPLHSPAWCGLGCSLVADPIKAQHAFSRAIQLDLVSADSYADLGFLYLEQDALLKSAEVCDVLTQLADTPVTWLNRAYRLEDEVSNQEEKEEHVSDAYRAALQVRKDPYALLGLAASYRAAAAVVETDAHIEWENHVLLEEYESITSIAPSTESVISPDRVKDLPGDPYLNSPSSVALKQQIIRNPDRGDLWLALGEEILSTTTEENSERHMNAAKAAVQRASMLFLDRLSTPCKGEKGFVSSSNLSSSLALENWLATDEAPADTRKAQLALLICPQNVLARNLLLDGHCPSV